MRFPKREGKEDLSEGRDKRRQAETRRRQGGDKWRQGRDKVETSGDKADTGGDKDLNEGGDDPDSDKDGVAEHALEAVHLVVQPPRVQLVEELHPHEHIVDHLVSNVYG